ncbi:MAG: HlyD family efflux transporter periplasmic adaptor subunit [Oscillospiraceae bacterium]|nr:HlyD family efflux transporter periplasmic adaptor subunit [Oscillospiraceae bacterium]
MSMAPRQSKAAARRKRVRRTIIILLVVAVVLVAGVLFLRQYVTENYGSTDDGDEIQTAEVTTGSIISTVSGSGTLTSDDVEEVTIPSSVTISTYYVSEDDTVEEGDILATVDTDSVLEALADVQTQLDELDEELEEASEDSVSSTLTSSVSGRVKVIYAEADDDVSTVMYEYGALMILSLDGYMAVDIETTDYEVGDSVTVVDSDGDSYTGTVSAVSAGVTTILLTDNGPVYEDTVTVDDTYTGTLYIHEPLKITGYAGTVSSVSVSENTSVSSGTTLLNLSNTSYSANYNQLLVEREELEELYQTLITLYKDGAITAPVSGTVESVSSTSSSSSSGNSSTNGMTGDSASGSSSSETTVVTIDPNTSMSVTISVDETDILSVAVGQEASLTISSIGDDTFTGSVTEVDKTATSSGGVSVYSVVVTVDKTEEMLSGMSASVYITIEGVDNALLLPEEAVQTTSSTAYVYTEYDETTGELSGMVEVTTGLSNGTYIEITDGLSEGDTVYYTTSEDEFSSFSFGGMDRSDSSGFSMGGGSSGGGMDMGGGSSFGGGGMPGGE